jgi:stress response protein YsnF
MQLPNSQPDAADDDNSIIKEKNNDLKEERNPLIVSPASSEKVRIIIKSPTLKDKESLISKVEEVFESVKENTSNLINKAVKVEEQDISSFQRFSEKVSQTPPQQESNEEEFVIPVIAEDYSLSKKTISKEINIEKRWVEHEEIKIPVRYEKVFVNDKEIDVYSKQGVISQIKEKISDLVQSNKEENETKEGEEKEDTKNQIENKEIENKKRGGEDEEELQLKGEIVPLFDNQQNQGNNIPDSNNKELTKDKRQALIPIYAEEITISKKLVKVGEILLSKRRVIEEENVNVDTTKERISVEHPDGRKEKLTGY